MFVVLGCAFIRHCFFSISIWPGGAVAGAHEAAKRTDAQSRRWRRTALRPHDRRPGLVHFQAGLEPAWQMITVETVSPTSPAAAPCPASASSSAETSAASQTPSHPPPSVPPSPHPSSVVADCRQVHTEGVDQPRSRLMCKGREGCAQKEANALMVTDTKSVRIGRPTAVRVCLMSVCFPWHC